MDSLIGILSQNSLVCEVLNRAYTLGQAKKVTWPSLTVIPWED
jgi:hypothetical protein